MINHMYELMFVGFMVFWICLGISILFATIMYNLNYYLETKIRLKEEERFNIRLKSLIKSETKSKEAKRNK